MNEYGLVLGPVLAMMAVLAGAACSTSKVEPTAATDASVIRFAVADAAAADAADAAIEESPADAGPNDRELLLTCEVDEPCPESRAELIERSPIVLAPSTVCLMEALQERKPGRYIHGTRSAHGQGDEGVDHVLIVRADGTALYARMVYVDVRGSVITEMSETPEPAQLCTLRDPSYFAECAAAMRQVKPNERVQEVPWQCAFGEGDTKPGELKWFESCEAAPATCE